MASFILISLFIYFVANGYCGDEDYATTYRYIYWKSTSGKCFFSEIGYRAGGQDVNITKTVPPSISLEKMALSEIAGKGEQGTTIVFEGINTAKEWKKLRDIGNKAVQTVGKWGRRLAGSLGLIGGIFSIVSSELELSAEDVAERTNEAFRQMAREVDNKMSQMKGYVDQKLIELQRNLLQTDLNLLQNLYTECVLEIDLQNMLVCLKEAAQHIRIFAAKFMANEAYIREGRQLTPYEVKNAELSLLPFKDYANLCIMVMSTLAGTIEDKIEDDGVVSQYPHLRHILKKHIALLEKFKTYANWHVEEIVRVHTKSRSCEESLACFRTAEETDWNSITTECECLIDPTLVESDTCKLKLYSRESITRGSYYETMPSPPEETYPKDFAKSNFITKTYAKVKTFTKDAEPKIRKYWEDQLLGFVEVWDEALQVAQDKLETLEKKRKKKKASKKTKQTGNL